MCISARSASKDKPLIHKALQALYGVALPIVDRRSVCRDQSGCAAVNRHERSDVMSISARSASKDKPLIHKALLALFGVALPTVNRE